MISVDAARAKLLTLVTRTGVETVGLRQAAGRVLAEDVLAARDQPPFDASAMDGYAVAMPDGAAPPTVGALFEVVGEAAAGRAHGGTLVPGQAARIFTGAPVPDGADRVLLQEDVARDASGIRVSADVGPATHVRPRGGDFAAGDRHPAGSRLRPVDVGLCAAMGADRLAVRRKPDVAIVMTGDELTMPGEDPGPAGIHASNGFAVAAMIEAEGGAARLLPIARDRPGALRAALDLAAGADLVVTIGGASVGDHDLVAATATDAGMDLAFHKVLMRPGKPLLAGRIGSSALVGLPGNPVSSIVCTMIFVLPMIRAMLGLAPLPVPTPRPLAAPLPPNGPREHYMRATLSAAGATPVERQDSSLLRVLSLADTLIVRPPDAPAASVGTVVPCIDLPRA